MKKKLFTLLCNLCFTFILYKCFILILRFAIEYGFFDLRVILCCLIAFYVSEFHSK